MMDHWAMVAVGGWHGQTQDRGLGINTYAEFVKKCRYIFVFLNTDMMLVVEIYPLTMTCVSSMVNAVVADCFVMQKPSHLQQLYFPSFLEYSGFSISRYFVRFHWPLGKMPFELGNSFKILIAEWNLNKCIQRCALWWHGSSRYLDFFWHNMTKFGNLFIYILLYTKSVLNFQWQKYLMRLLSDYCLMNAKVTHE